MSLPPLQLGFPAEGLRGGASCEMGGEAGRGERRRRGERGGEEAGRGEKRRRRRRRRGRGLQHQPRRPALLQGRWLLPQDPATFQQGLSGCFSPGFEPSSQTLFFRRKQHKPCKAFNPPRLGSDGAAWKSRGGAAAFLAPCIPFPFFPFLLST